MSNQRGEGVSKHLSRAGSKCLPFTLSFLLLSFSELRKLFSDLGVVGRDVFADAASKAAETARPDEEALAKADAPAPDNEFHDDIPEALKKKNLDEAKAKKEELKDEAKNQADNAADANDPNSKKTPAEALKDGQAALASKIPQKHKDLAKEHTEKTKEYLKEKFVSILDSDFSFRFRLSVLVVPSSEPFLFSAFLFFSLPLPYLSHSQRNVATSSSTD